MSFTIESEKQNRMSFLDAQIICEDKIFTTSVYHKRTFSEISRHLTVFYHLPISLVLFSHSLIDACKFDLVELNYAMN